MIGTRLPRSSLHPFPESTRISTGPTSQRGLAYFLLCVPDKVNEGNHSPCQAKCSQWELI